MDKLNRALTAISLADVGDFDGVRDILRQNAPERDKQKNNATYPCADMAAEQEVPRQPVGAAGQR